MEKKVYYNEKQIGIALTAFNRPTHLSSTLKSIKKNNVKKLYVFCDSANEDDLENIKKNKEVVLIIQNIKWCEVVLIQHQKNMGCKKNHLYLMEYMFQKYDKIIVLEDDLIFSPHLIEFISECLIKYEFNDRIKNVTGFCHPIKIPEEYKYDIYFLQRHSSWSVGTWKRVYNEFCNLDLDHRKILTSKNNRRKLKKGGSDTIPLMTSDYFGWVSSYGIWWCWNSLNNDGLNIYPSKSLLQNIGHDDSGTHSGLTDKYRVNMDNEFKPRKFPKILKINQEIEDAYFKFIKLSRLAILIYNLPLFMIKVIVPTYKKIFK